MRTKWRTQRMTHVVVPCRVQTRPAELVKRRGEQVNERRRNLPSTTNIIHTVSSPAHREGLRYTHDNAATKILCKLEDGFGDEGREPAGAPGEDGEEGTEHGAGHDDEDGRDADACPGGVAAAVAAVDAVVVTAKEVLEAHVVLVEVRDVKENDRGARCAICAWAWARKTEHEGVRVCGERQETGTPLVK